MHKAVVLEYKGAPLTIQPRQTPPVGPGQVLVRVYACGVNPVDWKVLKLGWLVESYPTVIGTDGAGVVERVGEGVTYVRPGDRVCFAGWYSDANSCAFQELSLQDEGMVFKIPESVSFEAAAGICLASFTAYVGLHHETGAFIPLALPGSPPPLPYSQPPDLSQFGPTITILGGSSSIGQYAIQFAKLAGFTKIITTSSVRHHEYLRSLGATHLFDRNASVQELAKAAAVESRPGAETTPVVFDAVATPETTAFGADLVREISEYAMLVSPLVVDDEDELPSDIEFRGIYALAVALKDASVPFYRAMSTWLETGDVKPNRIKVVGDLERVGEALDLSEKGVSGIKLVLTL